MQSMTWMQFWTDRSSALLKNLLFVRRTPPSRVNHDCVIEINVIVSGLLANQSRCH